MFSLFSLLVTMASCVVVTAYTCLLLGFLAVGFGFFAPFWVQYINDGAYEGLWGRCRDIEINVETGEDLIRFKCVWFHEDDFGWEKSKPGKRRIIWIENYAHAVSVTWFQSEIMYFCDGFYYSSTEIYTDTAPGVVDVAELFQFVSNSLL